jgi:hypothetical protein
VIPDRRGNGISVPRQREPREVLTAQDREDLIIYGRRFGDGPLRRLCQCCGLEDAELLVTNLDVPSQPLEVCTECSEANVNAISRAAAMAVGAR